MEIAYLAGIVDGEGHFCRAKCKNGQGRPYRQSRIIVTNTHKGLAEEIKATFGGNWRIEPNERKDGIKRKTCYRWTIAGKKAEELARKLQPYLIVKSEQVKRVLA